MSSGGCIFEALSLRVRPKQNCFGLEVLIMSLTLETRYMPGLMVRELVLSPEELFELFGILG